MAYFFGPDKLYENTQILACFIFERIFCFLIYRVYFSYFTFFRILNDLIVDVLLFVPFLSTNYNAF